MLSEAQILKVAHYFPFSHGVPQVHERPIVSVIIFVIKNDLQWRDLQHTYGPHKTIYKHFIRRGRLGVFNRILIELAGNVGEPDRL
jgi:putative transposase